MGLTDVFFRSRSDDREALSNVVLHLWKTVANGFRDDEQTLEAQRFQERTTAVQADVLALTPGATPDPSLMRRMVEVLLPAVEERICELHERIDELDDQCRTTHRELTTQQLAGSWQTDELERCRTMLVQALRGRETVMPSAGADGTAPLVTQLLAIHLHIEAPPPRPVAALGRRAETRAVSETSSSRTLHAVKSKPSSERAIIAQVLREVLDGTAQTPRLVRALEDQELAKRLADLAAEHRTYRGILQQIGVLPRE